MDSSSIILTAIALAMDAFAVCTTSSMTICGFKSKDALRLAFFCGLFQFLMPLIGWVLGSTISFYISKYDHWIAFILLGFIGFEMIRSSFSEDDDNKPEKCVDIKYCITVAIATSIDALAVGISFAVFKVNILYACSIIGICAFAISLVGGIIGKKFGGLLKTKAELFGGVILILIGLRILITHLFPNFQII